MSLTCELSGEPLSSAQPGEIVATPSGHVCLKRLLLAKLAENGGMDPFEPIRERPLSEDQLITLSASKSAPPPRPSVTSLPNLLHSIQSEYDALVLELFDTRKALEETRKELSQALYQNDAAVRVVARLSMERDEARQELERWNASVGTAPATAAAAEEEENDTQEPKSKRRKIESLMKNDLPEEDLNSMVETWQKLQPNRKPTLKAAAAAAPSQDDLAKYDEFDKKEWHKSTCKSVTCMATSGDLLVTAGTDKQLVVYHKVDKVVVHTIPLGTVATCIDSSGSLAVIGDAKGKMAVYSVEDGSSLGTWQATEGGIVDVRIHPTTKHVCVTTSAGQLTVCCLLEGSVQAVAQFAGDDSVQYTCGALHPDGLLYAAGTSTGKVHMWDFKNKVLASTLQEGDVEDAMVTVSFSNNGYHLATAHESAKIKFWDLRKQKTLAIMNSEKDLLASITAIAYDESGKYVAFGGKGGVQITTVKEWGTTASLSTKIISGIVWSSKPSTLVTCGKTERTVRFFGLS